MLRYTLHCHWYLLLDWVFADSASSLPPPPHHTDAQCPMPNCYLLLPCPRLIAATEYARKAISLTSDLLPIIHKLLLSAVDCLRLSDGPGPTVLVQPFDHCASSSSESSLAVLTAGATMPQDALVIVFAPCCPFFFLGSLLPNILVLRTLPATEAQSLEPTPLYNHMLQGLSVHQVRCFPQALDPSCFFVVVSPGAPTLHIAPTSSLKATHPALLRLWPPPPTCPLLGPGLHCSSAIRAHVCTHQGCVRQR